MTARVAWMNCDTAIDVVHQKCKRQVIQMVVYWRKHVKMGDKFHRNEDNGTRQTPRHWRCDRTSSLMSMYITISRANSILDATMSPNPPTHARSSMRSCFIANCDLSERVFDKSVRQTVISDLAFYIPLNYAVNVSSNTLWLRFSSLTLTQHEEIRPARNSVNSFSKIQRMYLAT